MSEDCPYDGGKIIFKDSSIVYGKSYGMVYICENYPKCDAFVGVHKGTTNALGTLANGKLRELRKRCHSAFDHLWEKKILLQACSRRSARASGYKWLAEQLAIDPKDCHIAMFDFELCHKALQVLKPYLNRKARKVKP